MKISTCEDLFRCVDLSLLSRLVNGIKSAEYKLDHEVLRGFLYGEYSDRELASLVDEAEHNATGQKLVDPQE
mgnify:CR=1 FL=1